MSKKSTKADAPDRGRFSASRKTQAVFRLLRGEDRAGEDMVGTGRGAQHAAADVDRTHEPRDWRDFLKIWEFIQQYGIDVTEGGWRFVVDPTSPEPAGRSTRPRPRTTPGGPC